MPGQDLLVTIPGSRGRIGVIQPAPGLVLEAEWSAVMPPGVAFPVTRVPLFGGTPSDYAAMGDHAFEAAATLANAQADAIAYACGVGSLYRGPAFEAELCAGLSQAAGGLAVMGMAAASLAAIERFGACRIAVITPYGDAVNALVCDYLAAAGLTVAICRRLPVASPVAAAELGPRAIIDGVAAMRAAAPDADLIWMPCSNLHTLAIIDQLEELTDRPVVSSNLALLWRMLALVGVPDKPVRSRLFDA